MKPVFYLCAAVCLRAAPAHSAPMTLNPVEPLQKLFDAGKYDDVINKLSDAEMEKIPRSRRPQAYILSGLSHRMRGEIDKALGVYQVAAEIFPKDINVVSHLASLLQDEGLDDRARPLYDQILKMHPHNAAAHFGIAKIEHAAGFWESAADHYRQCLTAWKDNAMIWRDLAEVLTERRDFRGAIDAIGHSLALDADAVDSLKALAMLEFRQDMHEKAYRTLDRALSMAGRRAAGDSTRRELSLQYALWLLEDGNLDGSLAMAQSVLRESPQDSLGLWIRGIIALKRGNPRDARRDLESAAASERQTPFVAQAARSILRQISSP